jgi:drug/metabolite transporter (DMT)-like permease
MALGEPVATIAMVAVIFGEVPSAVKLLGCGLILAGLGIASHRRTAEDELVP